MGIFVNSTICTKCLSMNKNSASVYRTYAGESIMNLSAGDRIYIASQGDGTDDLIVKY